MLHVCIYSVYRCLLASLKNQTTPFCSTGYVASPACRRVHAYTCTYIYIYISKQNLFPLPLTIQHATLRKAGSGLYRDQAKSAPHLFSECPGHCLRFFFYIHSQMALMRFIDTALTSIIGVAYVPMNIINTKVQGLMTPLKEKLIIKKKKKKTQKKKKQKHRLLHPQYLL